MESGVQGLHPGEAIEVNNPDLFSEYTETGEGFSKGLITATDNFNMDKSRVQDTVIENPLEGEDTPIPTQGMKMRDREQSECVISINTDLTSFDGGEGGKIKPS